MAWKDFVTSESLFDQLLIPMIIKDISMRVRVKLLEREKRCGKESKMNEKDQAREWEVERVKEKIMIERERELERKKNDREGERVRKRKDRIHIDWYSYRRKK